MVDQAHIEKLSRELVDKGKLIEAGWVSLRLTVIPDGVSPEQLEDMRMAFFAGAQHLFGSLMTILEPDADATEADLNRMELINTELENFIKELLARDKGEAP